MATKKIKMTEKVEKQEQIEETAASDTIASKTGVIASVGQAVAGMSQDQVDVFHNYIVDFFNKSLAQASGAAISIGQDQSAKNQATIAAKGAMQEDVDNLFSGEQLTEEFKNKAQLLFESAVTARVSQIEAELEEKSAEIIAEEIENKFNELVDGADKYLSYVANQWLEDNKVEIVESLEFEILKELHGSVVEAYKLHNITIPESKVDVVEQLMDEVASLRNELNEQTNRVMEAEELEARISMENVFDNVSESLTKLDKEKLRGLCESVEFDGNIDEFARHITIIRDHHFKAAKSAPKSYTTGILTEGVDEEKEAEHVLPSISRYADAITRTSRKS